MNVDISSPGSIEHYSNFNNFHIFQYPCTSQTSCVPYRVTCPKGLLKMQLWGGNGGPSNSDPEVPGGKGGYSDGIIRLYRTTLFYLYVGAHGEKSGSKEVFGGGGPGTSRSYDAGGTGGGSGGGASDIRLEEGGDETLDTRIIVAAGGAGSEMYVYPSYGGFGGGYVGGDGDITQKPEYSIHNLKKSKRGKHHSRRAQFIIRLWIFWTW